MKVSVIQIHFQKICSSTFVLNLCESSQQILKKKIKKQFSYLEYWK